MAQPSPIPGGDDREIGDVDDLFRDPSKPRSPVPPPAGSDPDPGPGPGYDLAGDDPSIEDEPPSRPAAPNPFDPVASPPRRPKPAVEPDAERSARSSPAREARVDQVWSRGAEWGGTLLLLGVVGLVIATLAYMTLRVENLKLPLLILMVGGAVMLVLTYPIVITLERPVRMTPEQAANDFYGALSHHAPHYKRMWLLLSSDGRVCSSYGSYEGFKAYWKGRLKQLRGNHAGGWTPLNFRVDEFKADKSVGKTTADAKFTINVFIRGKQDAGPIDSIRVETGLVRGPDQMWYLNKGTLPGARP